MIGNDKNQLERDKINTRNRQMLRNKDFSLISENCNGGFILHDLGIRFNSPTVNLFFYPKDFIKYVKNLKYYSSLKLEFIRKANINYPIGKLDDIEIYFMHYETEELAKQKWEERTKRINYDNIFILMTDRDGCTEEDLQEFDSLPYKNKVILTHLPHENIKSCFYIKGFEDQKEIGHIYRFKNETTGKKFYDDFDYVSWFNTNNKVQD